MDTVARLDASPTPPESSAGNPPDQRDPGSLLYDFVVRHEIVFLLLLLGLIVVGAAYSSHHKRFWYDELFTVWVATQPTWQKFAAAMPPEGNPPIHTVLTRLSVHLFGLSEFAVRLPPLLGFLGAMTGLYIFVRRECGAMFGLVAVTLVLAEPAWKYSFEARPYGQLLGFVMLALVSWQAATRAHDQVPSRTRILALCGIVAGIVGSILSHNIGVVEVGIPLLFGEVARTMHRRRFDWPILATALAAIPALSISLPMAHRTKSLLLVLSPFFSPPITLHKIHNYFLWSKGSWPLVISTGMLGFLALVLLLTWCPRALGHRVTPTRRSFAPHIVSATVGLLLLIPITWFAMMTAGGWYFCRYGIGSVVGISIGTCLLLARRAVVPKTLMICLMIFLAAAYVRGFVDDSRDEQQLRFLSDRIMQEDRTNLPIVFSDAFRYPTIWWYAPESTRNRVVFLGDRTQVANTSDSLVEVCLMAERPYIAAPLEDVSSFITHQDHFLLEGRNTSKLKERLESAGYTVALTRTEGLEQLYDVQRNPQAPAPRGTGQRIHANPSK